LVSTIWWVTSIGLIAMVAVLALVNAKMVGHPRHRAFRAPARGFCA
jgi:uncharacterized membrane protein